MVFDKVNGCTLEEMVQQNDPDDSIDLGNEISDSSSFDCVANFDNERKIKKFARKLLFSVARIHELGIAHRDLKMDNIMVLDADQIRIIDFGVSATFDPDKEEPQLSNLAGTPHYIAPEILNQSKYDEKVDIWSAGVIIYLLFSRGKFPFDGSDEEEIFKAIRKGKFKLPGRKASGDNEFIKMSAEAQDFLQQLLQISPSKRLSAPDALLHPWLSMEKSANRKKSGL